MFCRFQKYIEEQQLLTTADCVLLAVSGGVDSMVMLELFRRLGQNILVAHCNFQLRGAESNGDEQFVREYCQDVGIPFYVSHFETEDYARMKGQSIEMAARELRYQWFEELRIQTKASEIATAHHQDDLIETMLINLIRGTGIRGLEGIAPRRDHLIRPLLFAGRAEIQQWANNRQLAFRFDSSNDELVYQRNVIRHQILPILDQLNPAFRKNAVRTASLLRETAQVYEERIAAIRKQIMRRQLGMIYVALGPLTEMASPQTILYEILRPYGFNRSVVADVFQSLTSESGRRFYAKNYSLVKDRDQLILTGRTADENQRFYLDEGKTEIDFPVRLRLRQMERNTDFRLSGEPLTADIDSDKLNFPLILKRWDKGEYFQPLGMSGMKKISDYFIDIKLSLPEKKNTWILYSGRKVVWIIGHRLDDRVKIDASTQHILRISCIQS